MQLEQKRAANILMDSGTSKQLAGSLDWNAEEKREIVWTSSDEGVAVVDAQGKVTAIDAGTARITAAVSDGETTADFEITVTVSEADADMVGRGVMFRLYNPNSGEHFYTMSLPERNRLLCAGWNYEGGAWISPRISNTPVYRIYNPNGGDHHYTVSPEELIELVAAGWKYEGIGWYSDDGQTTPLHRLYNPNAGSHHYTSDEEEKGSLLAAGWIDEGIGWFGQ